MIRYRCGDGLERRKKQSCLFHISYRSLPKINPEGKATKSCFLFAFWTWTHCWHRGLPMKLQGDFKELLQPFYQIRESFWQFGFRNGNKLNLGNISQEEVRETLSTRNKRQLLLQRSRLAHTHTRTHTHTHQTHTTFPTMDCLDRHPSSLRRGRSMARGWLSLLRSGTCTQKGLGESSSDREPVEKLRREPDRGGENQWGRNPKGTTRRDKRQTGTPAGKRRTRGQAKRQADKHAGRQASTQAGKQRQRGERRGGRQASGQARRRDKPAGEQAGQQASEQAGEQASKRARTLHLHQYIHRTQAWSQGCARHPAYCSWEVLSWQNNIRILNFAVSRTVSKRQHRRLECLRGYCYELPSVSNAFVTCRSQASVPAAAHIQGPSVPVASLIWQQSIPTVGPRCRLTVCNHQSCSAVQLDCRWSHTAANPGHGSPSAGVHSRRGRSWSSLTQQPHLVRVVSLSHYQPVKAFSPSRQTSSQSSVGGPNGHDRPSPIEVVRE